MIKNMEIENYILFEKEEINFSEFANVLTGKTGSGKSIFISAIKFISGNSASKDLFFQAEQNVRVKAIIKVNDAVSEKLDELDIEYEKEIEVTRVLTPTMKNKVRVNGELISVGELKTLFSDVIDIHSQFETIKLKDSKQYLKIIDSFIKSDEITKYREKYEQLKQGEKLEQELLKRKRDQDERKEIIHIRLAKIDKLELNQDLEELLEQKKRYEEMKSNNVIYEELVEGINYFLNNATSKISSIKDESINEELNEAIIKLEDVSYKISEKNITFDEREYEKMVDNISNIKSSMRNFNMEFSELKAYKDQLEKEKSDLESVDIDLENIRSKMIVVKKEMDKLAANITKNRTMISEKMVVAINKEIKELEMPDTEFKIEISDCEYNISGKDEVLFLLKINAGNEFMPIDKSASGGELARFNLALKTVVSAIKNGELIIFDEIDTGVSGSVASKMAIKMQKIAKDNQVMVITHLPQVAVIGKEHYEIQKVTENEVTKSHMRHLDYSGRINNIASLISSDNVTKEAQKHAEKLFEEAQEKENYE